MQNQAGDITRLLAGWRAGDRSALDRLLPLVRAELDRLARRHLSRERLPHQCSLPRWCRKRFCGFCPVPTWSGTTGPIFSLSRHR